jgi:hypothetical protein
MRTPEIAAEDALPFRWSLRVLRDAVWIDEDAVLAPNLGDERNALCSFALVESLSYARCLIPVNFTK